MVQTLDTEAKHFLIFFSWEHYLKMIILIKKTIPPIFKTIKRRKFILKLQTRLTRKFQLNVKVPE